MSKNRIWQKICGVGAVLVLLAGGAAEAAVQSPTVQVGLETSKTEHTITANVPFNVTDEKGKRTYLKLRANQKAVIAIGKKGITINGKEISASKVMVHVNSKSKKGILKLDGTPYRGNLCIDHRKGKTKLTTVNEVMLEDYLYGVVPNEVSHSWPMEALKAQAVAARTFVLHDLKKHASEGYDVCATTHCQVYRGKQKENVRTNQAVDATKGEYLAYKGKAILSLFHASGGGYTENSENVWGKREPYLRGVPDYNESPWEVNVTLDKLSSVLKSCGKAVGEIREIKLSKLEKQPVKVGDRGISGRVRTMTIEGERGSVQVSGNDMRSMLGLKSTLFDIDKRTFKGKESESFTIKGYGFGHGLGMSQWGAKAMAEKKKDYEEILKHYYSQVDIKKIK